MQVKQQNAFNESVVIVSGDPISMTTSRYHGIGSTAKVRSTTGGVFPLCSLGIVGMVDGS